jgi:hypothetical protein
MHLVGEVILSIEAYVVCKYNITFNELMWPANGWIWCCRPVTVCCTFNFYLGIYFLVFLRLGFVWDFTNTPMLVVLLSCFLSGLACLFT